MALSPFTSVAQLLQALESLRDRPTEDVVPARAHLLQTAERLAATRPDDPELVVAGLVHDLATALGHRDEAHEVLGAELVAPLLGTRVGALVAAHVDAKRYLVTTEPTYGSVLSEHSTASLRAQGGAMREAEAASFRRRPDWEAMVALRRADDAAKVPDAPLRPVAEWRGVLEAVAAGRDGPRRRSTGRPGSP
jgi:predicted HD phosphohydrolase